MQCDEAEALTSLLGIMAATPRGSWRGDPLFGLRDLLEQSRLRPEKARLAVEELNRALLALDIRSCRVTAIESRSTPEHGSTEWVVMLESADGSGKSWSVEWNGNAGRQ